MRTQVLPIAGLLLGMAASSAAEETDYYVSLAAGLNHLSGVEWRTDDPIPATVAVGVDEWATAGAGALGVDGGVWRLELEAAYRNNEGGTLQLVAPVVGAPSLASIELRAVTALANAYVDLPVGERFTFSLGAGAGVAYLNANVGIVPFAPFIQDEAFELAVQGVAALAYRVSSTVDLAVEYRYLSVESPVFANGLGGPTTYEFDGLGGQGVFLSVRHRFAG